MLLNGSICRKVRPVTLRFLCSHSERSRAFIAAIVLCTIVAAIGLSGAPRLHKWLHDSGSQPKHECAATLLSSGSLDRSACEPISAQPHRVPVASAFRLQGYPCVLKRLAVSLLEHAPPAVA